MKRDMNLIREMLLWAEKQEHGFIYENPEIDGYSAEEIGYHAHLIGQSGLAIVHSDTDLSSLSPSAFISSITNEGYEFIDVAKDNNIWAKAKETVLKPGVSMTFSLLFEWLKSEAKVRLGLP